MDRRADCRRGAWVRLVVAAAARACGACTWADRRGTGTGTVTCPFPALWPARNPNAQVGAASKGDHSDEIEVCGVGKVKLDSDDAVATGKYLDALTKNSRLRWLAALRNSDDYRARATGLYLEGILDQDSPQKDPDAARDELVQLAVATKDPAAFALAYTKCIKAIGDFDSQTACPQLALDDWTRADAP